MNGYADGDPLSGRRSPELAGEDQREPVHPHRRDRRGGAVHAQVEGQQLRRPLELLGVVDRGGGDGAVPVVGADDLPADVAGLLGDASGQAGDGGVVVDLDVDLAALDGGLGGRLLEIAK